MGGGVGVPGALQHSWLGWLRSVFSKECGALAPAFSLVSMLQMSRQGAT